jgi:hypothetical protein
MYALNLRTSLKDVFWLSLLTDQGKDKTAEERRIAICIFDDIAEHCREAALK